MVAPNKMIDLRVKLARIAAVVGQGGHLRYDPGDQTLGRADPGSSVVQHQVVAGVAVEDATRVQWVGRSLDFA